MADLIAFRALGRLELTRGSMPVPLLRRRQKLALFTVLTLSRSSFRSRDSLQAMFWPESDQNHALRSLNTAVHVLRETLGADVIVSRGDDDIGVAADLVWCDVRAFDEAIAAGDLAQAMDVYAGDLLEGFFISGALGFEHWLDGERDRLRRAAHGAAWQCAERAEQARHLAEAAKWARRAVEVLFDDEPGVRRSVSLLDRAGDRMGAVQMYEHFAQHLQNEYSTKPAPETRRLIAKILARDEPHALPEPPHERRIETTERQIQPAEPQEGPTADNALPTGPTKTDAPADAPTPSAAEDRPPPTPSASPGGRGWWPPQPSADPPAPTRPAPHHRFSSQPVWPLLAAAAVIVTVGATFWLTRRVDVGSRASAEPPTELQTASSPIARPRIVISQFAMLGGNAELGFLFVPVRARRGVRASAMVDVAMDVRSIVGRKSKTTLMDQNRARELILVHFDSKYEQSGRLASDVYVSIVSPDLALACVDARVDVDSFQRPNPHFSNDTLWIQSSEVVAGTVRLLATGYVLDTSSCAWLPVERSSPLIRP